MKNKLALIMALGLTLPAITFAEDKPQPRDGGDRPPRHEGGRQGEGRQMPPPPIIGALDANHDGTIDEKEIAQASKSLKKLDKNGDGKLTMEELRPPRPEGAPEGGSQDGPRRRGGRGGPEGEKGPGDGPRHRPPPPGDKE